VTGSTHKLTIIHRVPDIDRWMAVLMRRGPARPGLVRRAAYRSVDDTDEVMVELEFDSAESAQAFLPSLDLREVLDDIGLDIYPPVFIGVELDELHVEYQAGSD
jgi:hypothetical protein